MSDSYEINGAASPLSPVGAKLFGADASGNPGWLHPSPPAQFKRFSLLGDSLTDQCGHGIQVDSITQTGGVATMTVTGTNLWPGQKVMVWGANQSGYNGIHTIIASPTPTTATYAVPADTVSPATTSLQFFGRIDDRRPVTSWWAWFQGMCGGAPELSVNAGISGDTSTGALARVSWVTESDADCVIVCIGHNDLFWQEDLSLYIDAVYGNIVAICEAIIASGKAVALMSLECEYNELTSTQRQQIVKINQMLFEYTQGMPNVYWVNMYAQLLDYTSADGAAKANAHWDGIHVSAYGASLVARALYTALQDKVVKTEILPVGRLGSTNQIFTNSTLQGADGWLGDVTGTAPSDLFISGAAASNWTCSIVPRTVEEDGDAIGNNVVVASANAAVGDTLVIRTNDYRAALATYDKFWCECHLKFTGYKNFSFVRCCCLNNRPVGEWIASAIESTSAIAGGAAEPEIDLKLRSLPVGIPSDSTFSAFAVIGTVATAGPVSVTIGRLGVFAE